MTCSARRTRAVRDGATLMWIYLGCARKEERPATAAGRLLLGKSWCSHGPARRARTGLISDRL
jgi:hypothetical protein